ncbi:translocation/assembly module TamB domain-containing protein [Phorcysia thermohydrogeniphila]|uniref:Translocation and assembly module TamB n=1 Tax=Phorcysia thermohydrogeniphila TaxID=936138 RepID=A0A4R1GH91_9BACT|nr:translocation/assembly module TamB domain-containing protein [Phorcysia thermohydrogeniphila]TCK06330.1 translocation and assembly module TamB [Phorcysia thermohydrogeniphila]
MKIDRELLKELLRSLRKGRLHRLLKLILLSLLVYFSVLVVRDLAVFYFQEKKITGVEYSGISISFSKGEVTLKVEKLFISRPTFKLSVSHAKTSLRLWESIKKLHPHFSEISVTKLQIEKAVKKEREFLPIVAVKLPFYVERLKLGELLYKSGKTTLHLKGLEIDERRALLKGIKGESGNVKFTVPETIGTVEGNRITLPNFTLKVNNLTYSGRVSLTKDLENAELKGTIEFKNIKTSINLRKLGNTFSLEGKVSLPETPVNYSISGKIGREIEILNGLISYQEAKSSFYGRLNLKELSIKGNISGNRISIAKVVAKEISGNYVIDGTYSSPSLSWQLRAKELKTPLAPFSDVSSRGKLTCDALELQVDSTTLSLTLLRSKSNTSGSFHLKRFNIDSLYPISKVKEKYGRWIPEVTLTGKGDFSLTGKEDLNYSAKLKIENFFFRGFKDKGSVDLKGNRKTVHYTLHLDKVNSEGTINLAELAINASFSGNSLPISEFDFLRKIGLEGKASFTGKMQGSLKNPEGHFSFSVPDFGFRGVYIGKVDGNIALSNFHLKVQGKAKEEDITLEELSLHLKEPMELHIALQAKEIPLSMPIAVLKSFKINLPLELSGIATGSFSLDSKNVKDLKENIDVKVKIENASGRYNLANLSGSAKDVSGYINYIDGNLWVLLAGKNRRVNLQGSEFTEGEFSLLLKNKILNVSFNGVKYPKIPESLISGTVRTDLGNQTVEGEIKVKGKFAKKDLVAEGSITTSISGTLNSITAQISGNVKVNHPYLSEPLTFKAQGILEEPSGTGYLALERENSTLRLLAYRNKFHLTGILRGIEFKTPAGRVLVKTSFINLSLSSLDGQITVPAFEIKPKEFYKLFSISGIYITLKGGKPEISGCRLSYTDGWVELEEIKLEEGKVSGKLNAETGIKGLLYLKDIRKGIKYVKGNLLLQGNFKYDKELHYSLSISASRVEGKVDYILEKLNLVNLNGKLEDGKLKEISAEISVGDGSIVISGTQEELIVSVSEVPIGELSLWKSVISGNGTLRGKNFSGKFNLLKTKVLFGEKSKKGKGKNSPELPIKLSISLNFADPVTLKSPVFQMKILPRLKVETVNKKPVISGSFTSIEGSIDYMGKKFKVLYGTGIIDNLAEEKGSVDILASTYISGYYIYMNIKGSFKEPKLFLTSDPPLTREQILNLIMTGATPEQIEESSELFPAVQIAYYATASFLKPLEKQFKRTLGLESFSIEPYITKYGETVAKVSIVKKLGQRFKLIGYETTGQKPEYGGSLQYFLTDRHYLETKYNSYYGVEFGIGIELNMR